MRGWKNISFLWYNMDINHNYLEGREMLVLNKIQFNEALVF